MKALPPSRFDCGGDALRAEVSLACQEVLWLYVGQGMTVPVAAELVEVLEPVLVELEARRATVTVGGPPPRPMAPGQWLQTGPGLS